jgi:DNA invertase Pin-like site-specific DNA recombinase
MRRSPRRRARTPQQPQVIRAAGYVRCSTEDQSARSDFNTLDNQKLLITRHVNLRAAGGDRVELAGFYVDDGYSGKNMERPGLARLLHDIEQGEVQMVVVYKMDRITRSLSDFFQMDAVMEEHGCSLVSFKEQFDTSTPMGRAMRSILLVFAQLERETNGERVRDKMHTEARLGRFQGGQVPFGFNVVDKKLVPNPDEAPVVRLIFEKYAETRSLSAVRDTLIALGHRTRRREAKGRPVGGGHFTLQGI